MSGATHDLDAELNADLEADLEGRIATWRRHVERRRAIDAPDVDELEDHLRGQVADLRSGGLDDDEAFLIAVKRIGALDDLSREYAAEHSERLWKQLVLDTGAAPGRPRAPGRSLGTVLALAVGAGLAVKAPTLFGIGLESDPGFYLRNVAVLVLPFLAALLAVRRRLGAGRSLRLLVPPFVVTAVLLNAYPFDTGGSTEVLAAIHAPVLLWLAVGLVYAAGEWRSHPRRMDFIRFTGEWVVYYVLIALGGGVLVGLTLAGFATLGLDAGPAVGEWVVPLGAAGAVVVAGWLVEAKQGVVENIAPVLTRVFTPLTALMLLAFLVATATRGSGVEVDRELLILVDLVLVLVLGLLLYAVSARDLTAPPDAFDRVQLLVVVTALLLDVLMLVAMLTRIAAFGPSANKVAALGLNLVLLVNLATSARLLTGVLRGRAPFAALERWQTAYLPVYAAWSAVVVALFPPLFAFR